MPHGINDVAIMRCNVERKRDVRAPTGELMVGGLSTDLLPKKQMPRTLARFPLLEYGPEFQEEDLEYFTSPTITILEFWSV